MRKYQTTMLHSLYDHNDIRIISQCIPKTIKYLYNFSIPWNYSCIYIVRFSVCHNILAILAPPCWYTLIFITLKLPCPFESATIDRTSLTDYSLRPLTVYEYINFFSSTNNVPMNKALDVKLTVCFEAWNSKLFLLPTLKMP